MPKRDLENTFSYTSATSSATKQITSLLALGAMDINNFNVNNYDNVRERTMFSNKANLRTASMSLSVSSEPYYKKMEWFNNLTDKEFREFVNSSQLLYNNNGGKGNQISKATNYEDRAR